MATFKKVCLVAPDGWTARLALGLQQHSPQCEVTIVGTDNSYPQLQAAAQVGLVTDNLFEGLRRTDLVLISRNNPSQNWNLRETVISCEQGTTICEFGRPVNEAMRLIREFNRGDVHYISIGITGVMDSVQPVSACNSDLYARHAVGLTPASIEDLQPFSILHEVLRSLGANVTAVSPQQHDRRLADVAYLPRLALMPVVRYWTENSDIQDAKSSLVSTAILDYLGEMTRQQMTEWVEEIFHSKAHVLRALEGYQSYLNILRQEIESDKLSDSAAHVLRQVADLKAEPVVESVQAALPVLSSAPSMDSVLTMLNTVWQTLEQLEQTAGSDEVNTDLTKIRELVGRTKSHLQQTKAPAVRAMPAKVEEPVAVFAETQETNYEPGFAATPISYEPTAMSYEDDVIEAEAETTIFEAPAPVYEAAPTEIEEEVSDVVAPPMHFVAPTPPAPVESHAASTRELWLHCGADVQAFATAARVLADARIGVENVDRQQSDQGVTVKLTLRDPVQHARARELLSQAGISVHA